MKTGFSAILTLTIVSLCRGESAWNAFLADSRVALFPFPASVDVTQTGLLPVDSKFDITLTGAGASSQRMQRAVNRYKALIKTSTGDFSATLTNLEIDIASNNETLDVGVNSSYSFTVDGGNGAKGSSQTIYGAMYLLETFSQLVDGAGRMVVSGISVVDDTPFVHRGIMVDTGRRFWPVTVLEEVIDAMSYLKMNVLHLHASDLCRESVASTTYPNLTAALTGIFAGHYEQSDIAALIEYAGDRGVRVMPEFDTPGHSKGMRFITEEGLEFCDDSFVQVYNDPKNSSYGVLSKFFGEMRGLFSDSHFHLGCDETSVVASCSLSSTAALERALFKDMLAAGKVPVAWEEALFDSFSAVPGMVVNAWSRHQAPEVVSKGYAAIESHSGWFYLNNANLPYTTLWQDITGNMSTSNPLYLGGEVSLWTDDFCPFRECDDPSSIPVAAPLFPPAQDDTFRLAALGLLFPRAVVGAGSFYRFDPAASSTSMEFEILYNTVADRLTERNIASCPTACTCDYTQRCGNYFIPCDAAASLQNVATYNCPQPGSAAIPNFQWKNQSGLLTLANDSSLCLGTNGKDPESGFPSAALVPCNATNPNLHFQTLPTSQIKNIGTGYCLDITASGSTPGSNVELYSCDTGTVYPNQQFSFDSNGLLINQNSKLCVGACNH